MLRGIKGDNINRRYGARIGQRSGVSVTAFCFGRSRRGPHYPPRSEKDRGDGESRESDGIDERPSVRDEDREFDT